jgi:predicted nuclease with TOPRIM domain
LAVLFGIGETVDEKQKLQKDLKDCQTELEKANEQLNSDYTARVGYVNMLKDSVEVLELEAKFKNLKAAQK